MAILIDRIDSEVEIRPDDLGRAPRPATSATTPANATGTAVQGALRGIVGRIMEQELDEYLRIRG